MGSNDSLEQKIANSRKESADGSLVTYDLTTDIDFSEPKKTAEALAKVFFEKDAVNWYQVSGDQIEFNPTYKVRIVLAEENGKKLGATVDDFLSDLQKDEISTEYASQISKNANNASNMHTLMAAGTAKNLLFHHSEGNVYKKEIRDDLFTDLLEKLEIRSLNNEDLMDWKKLPL